MTEERKHAADLLKAVESYRDAARKTLESCRRAHLAAAKSKQAGKAPRGIGGLPGGFSGGGGFGS